jgi:hypothetical protein
LADLIKRLRRTRGDVFDLLFGRAPPRNNLCRRHLLWRAANRLDAILARIAWLFRVELLSSVWLWHIRFCPF